MSNCTPGTSWDDIDVVGLTSFAWWEIACRLALLMPYFRFYVCGTTPSYYRCCCPALPKQASLAYNG